MSFDLFFWDPPGDCDDDDVQARYEQCCEEEPDEADEEAGESPRIQAFYEAVVERYPDHGALAKDSPWSSTPLDKADRFVAVSIRFSASDELVPWIQDLAREHRVVMLDPQDGTVYRPE